MNEVGGRCTFGSGSRRRMAPTVESLYCAEDVGASEWGEEHDVGVAESRVEVPVSGFQPAVFLDFPVEDDEAISEMLLKEGQHMPEASYSGRYRALELSSAARLEAVRWIQKVQSFYKYSPLTVVLAVNYMDRFLSLHHFPQGKEWMLQLLSVACISLAAKMEESHVPILLDLQVEKVEHVFEAHMIQRMELLVLSTLQWRMSVVTPFSYIDYFFHKLGISSVLLRALLTRVGDIVLKAVKDTTFLTYLPSVVAAAAIICSLEEVTALQSGDLLRIFASLSVDVDAVKRCYNDMQEVVMGSHYRRLAVKRKALSALEPQSPVGVLEAAALSCASEGTSGLWSRESSPRTCEKSPVATSSRFKRRKLLADDEPRTTTLSRHIT
ncbi:hypothetical protein KC19_10G111400 [Ceratodon purpureus]|uniref:Cyclin N-terminal domain-containing protein n=1 Tax=Ceratodon purpureus TaxID=3225 RepID=A0A8T0GMR2_CERPU|nr:hypothetical protein KC19_10G111400 [Ceratodon purpureus]